MSHLLVTTKAFPLEEQDRQYADVPGPNYASNSIFQNSGTNSAGNLLTASILNGLIPGVNAATNGVIPGALNSVNSLFPNTAANSALNSAANLFASSILQNNGAGIETPAVTSAVANLLSNSILQNGSLFPGMNSLNASAGAVNNSQTGEDLKPFDLFIDLKVPSNGLPPMKLNLGDISQYFPTGKNSRTGQNERHIVVEFQNPNRVPRPIPFSTFNAGLPVGSLVPGDIVKPCSNFIIKSCKKSCDIGSDICEKSCDNRTECIGFCKTTSKSCFQFCKSSLNMVKPPIDENESAPNKNVEDLAIDHGTNNTRFYLPKCLRTCNEDTTCQSDCLNFCSANFQPISVVPTVGQNIPNLLGNTASLNSAVQSIAPNLATALEAVPALIGGGAPAQNLLNGVIGNSATNLLSSQSNVGNALGSSASLIGAGGAATFVGSNAGLNAQAYSGYNNYYPATTTTTPASYSGAY